jgi:hypothetical protein
MFSLQRTVRSSSRPPAIERRQPKAPDAELDPPLVAKRKGQPGKIAPFRKESLMTFARGNVRGYDDDRMVLLFSMMDDGREVPCAVSGSAMDDLEHVPRTPAHRREEQFARLRDRIEACASRKFQAREFEGTPPGIIVRSIDLRS